MVSNKKMTHKRGYSQFKRNLDVVWLRKNFGISMDYHRLKQYWNGDDKEFDRDYITNLTTLYYMGEHFKYKSLRQFKVLIKKHISTMNTMLSIMKTLAELGSDIN